MTTSHNTHGSAAATRRRPVEAIEKRARRSRECEQRVRTALAKLTKAGVPFTVKDVCVLAGVGKTFVYDKRHPELTQVVLDARNASQFATVTRATHVANECMASWRERALNAEAHAKQLKNQVKERDMRISSLMGQLFDPSGTHLVDEVARLRDLLSTMNRNLLEAQLENQTLQRSLNSARANVKRERQRNVTALFGDHVVKPGRPS